MARQHVEVQAPTKGASHGQPLVREVGRWAVAGSLAVASSRGCLASVYDPQGDYDSAFGALATAITLQPGNAHFTLQSAAVHQDAGDFPAALRLYGRAVRLRGPVRTLDTMAAREETGDVLAKRRRSTAAITAYREAMNVTRNQDPYMRPRLKDKIVALQPGPS
jgi:tetratricopeptide (TPR) repeat protein